MASEIENYRQLLRYRYEELDQTLEALPDEALLWKPFDDSPWRGPCTPLGALAAHAVSSTVYLLRRAEWVLQRREWRDVDGDEGPEEFGSANHQLAYLRDRLWRTHALADEFLASLSELDADASRPHPADPQRTLSVRYDVVHAIEHLSEHIGQAQLTRQLWALQSA